MPRVVPEQKQRFENDELFRKLSRETEVIREFRSLKLISCLNELCLINTSNFVSTLFSQVKYTGYRDRSHEERIVRFQTELRDGQTHIVSAFYQLIV